MAQSISKLQPRDALAATMTERLARVLSRIDGYDPDDDPNATGTPHLKTELAFPPEARLWWRYRRTARAMIEAMRTPTEGMRQAGRDELGAQEVTGWTSLGDIVYERMIDAALTPDGKAPDTEASAEPEA